ncbi:hypothetical protein GCM10022243_40190 [Saccharothrix violaceirubra]|uniref:Uncharacterized protein (TIGR02678 family) n=1 Tax=Saccharothrix violaceirubra TaxID=413306 RepID=A0A7W7T844_9PSEU|nr:TIGR02678 family protein [Saccharothrix violaceirubra]MBB4968275.1 uncharacterized protein (TIGR02678 family) [Saccharothrix violaceirubra]
MDGLPDLDARDVVRCARTLLRRPLLRADGPEGELLSLVYRHRVALTELFARHLGYRLVVERRFARLHKAGPGHDGTRGVAGLSPRGYAYLAVTLAVLTGIGRQALLSRLVADIRAAAAEAGVGVVDDIADRRALTAALRHLVSLGVLKETEGSVEVGAEALITVDTDLLGQLVTGPVADAESADGLVELAARPGPRGVEHAVRRRLVEDPVVLHADLPAEASAWLREHQRPESALLEAEFGLYTECRVEGVLAADPEEYLSDLAFPGTSTVARMALLALPCLLEGDGGPDGRHPVDRTRLVEVCAGLVRDHPTAWSRKVVADLDELADEVMELLRRVGVAVVGPDGVSLNPVAHRWLPEPDGVPGPEAERPVPEEPHWSLFDEENV